MRKGTFPQKIDVLLKCLPESPFKEKLRAEIEAIAKEAYLKGSQDCYDAKMKERKICINAK